jgi:RimJ/RimL family protein N-acetyltransferase
MPLLSGDRLVLRIGPETQPPGDELKRMHATYCLEHEDPDIPFEKYETEVLHQYFCGKRGDDFGHYGILPAEAQEPVGHISFFARPTSIEALSALPNTNAIRSSVEAEIGWAIRKSHRSQGYATRGARIVLAYAFDKLNLHRVVAITQTSNAPSLRVMEKLGMSLHPFGDARIIGQALP